MSRLATVSTRTEVIVKQVTTIGDQEQQSKEDWERTKSYLGLNLSAQSWRDRHAGHHCRISGAADKEDWSARLTLRMLKRIEYVERSLEEYHTLEKLGKQIDGVIANKITNIEGQEQQNKEDWKHTKESHGPLPKGIKHVERNLEECARALGKLGKQMDAAQTDKAWRSWATDALEESGKQMRWRSRAGRCAGEAGFADGRCSD